MYKSVAGILSLIFVISYSWREANAKDFNLITNISQSQIQGQIEINVLNDIEKLTLGRVNFIWHDAGELVPVNMHINAVSTGAVPAAFTAFAYFGSTLPISNYYAGVPFSSDVTSWITWLTQGNGTKILQEVLTPLNIVAIPAMCVSGEAGGFYRKEIKTADDFNGLRFRIAGWGVETVAKLGAIVSQSPVTDLHLAMQLGRIDAMEFSSPALDESWGFHNLAKYYYFPGWHSPIGWEWLLINRKVWESFSQADQETIRSRLHANLADFYFKLRELDQAAMIRIQANSNIEVRRFPEPVLKALHTAWEQVIAEAMKKYPEIKKAHESFLAHKKKILDYEELQKLILVKLELN